MSLNTPCRTHHHDTDPHLIRRAAFSPSLILPLMPLRAALNISSRGVNIALTAAGLFFARRMLQKQGCC